jgi:hypothetical protein
MIAPPVPDAELPTNLVRLFNVVVRHHNRFVDQHIDDQIEYLQRSNNKLAPFS